MKAQVPTQPRYDARALWRQDKDHFIHPLTHFPSVEKGGALVISEGRGAHVFDADGKPVRESFPLGRFT